MNSRAQEASISAEDLFTPASEVTINDIILAATHEGGAGTQDYLRGREALLMTLDDTLQEARARNLLIQAQQLDREIATDRLNETGAVFNPAVNLSAAYSRTDSYNRSELIRRERGTNITFDGETNTTGQVPVLDDDIEQGRGVNSGTPQENLDGTGDNEAEDFDGGNVDPRINNDPLSGQFGDFVCVTVSGELINPEQCSLTTAISTQREFASGESHNRQAWDFAWGASKLFSWGSVFAADFRSTRRTKNFFPIDSLGLGTALSASNPIGRGSNFPWTTDFSLSLFTPLPYSRNFGAFGSPQNVGVKLTEVGQRQAEWSYLAVVNSVLRDVEVTYWDLVRNVKQLQIVLSQQGILEGLARGAARRLEARSITVYDKTQIDTQLENTRTRAEIAWNNLLVSSNFLIELLNYEGHQIILPIGYSADLQTLQSVDLDGAFDTARAHSPAIYGSRLASESQHILLKHRKVQRRPDLTFTVSVNLNQNDAVLGYDSWGDSLVNVFDPDSTDYFFGISYRVPLGNRVFKSALSQARIAYDQAQDQLRLTENSVFQSINSIISVTYSTQSQIRQSKAGMELAQRAYSKAVDLTQRDMVTEFELLNRLRTLLSAQSAYIDALVSHRQTKAQLGAAQGVLAQRTATMEPTPTPMTKVQRKPIRIPDPRITAVAGSGDLSMRGAQ